MAAITGKGNLTDSRPYGFRVSILHKSSLAVKHFLRFRALPIQISLPCMVRISRQFQELCTELLALIQARLVAQAKALELPASIYRTYLLSFWMPFPIEYDSVHTNICYHCQPETVLFHCSIPLLRVTWTASINVILFPLTAARARYLMISSFSLFAAIPTLPVIALTLLFLRFPFNRTALKPQSYITETLFYHGTCQLNIQRR
jgi:hypothetical protein